MRTAQPEDELAALKAEVAQLKAELATLTTKFMRPAIEAQSVAATGDLWGWYPDKHRSPAPAELQNL